MTTPAPATPAGGRSLLAPLGRALLCTALYALVCVWLTWPLARHAATHLPDSHPACRFDTLFTGWLLAYETQRLATDPGALAQANIYAPVENALFYGPTCAGALPVFAAVYAATGNPALGLNALFLGGAALSAAAVHLVVRAWTASHAAGFAAGAVFLLNRWLLWEFPPTAPNYAFLLYFAPIMFLLADARASWRRCALVAALVVAQALVHFGYIAPSVLGPLALLALVRIARPATRHAGFQLAAVVAVGALALVPELLAYRSVQIANPLLTEQTIWRGLAQPPTRVPEGLLAYQVPTAIAPIALAWIALGAVLRIARHRARAPGAPDGDWNAWCQTGFWVLAGTLLSLTPTIEVLGREIATPRAWAIEWLPFLGRLRVPSRLGLGAYVALAALAGLATAEIARRIAPAAARLLARGRGAVEAGARDARHGAVAAATAIALVAAVYAQYARGYGEPAYLRGPLPAAYPLAAAIDGSSPLLAVLREPGGPLLELPVGPGGLLPHFHTRAMYRSIFHGRRLVNGYDSYWPAGFPERMQLALRLPDADALAALRAETGLELVLVHAGELDAAERARWEALAAAGAGHGLRLLARDASDLLFAVEPAASADGRGA